MGPGRQLASLDKVTRRGSSDEASFEQDLDEVKQPGPQRLRGETFQGEGSESTRLQRQVLWEPEERSEGCAPGGDRVSHGGRAGGGFSRSIFSISRLLLSPEQ